MLQQPLGGSSQRRTQSWWRLIGPCVSAPLWEEIRDEGCGEVRARRVRARTDGFDDDDDEDDAGDVDGDARDDDARDEDDDGWWRAAARARGERTTGTGGASDDDSDAGDARRG